MTPKEAKTIADGMTAAATIIATAISGLTEAVFALVHTVDTKQPATTPAPVPPATA
jgi:hypothetical protein